MYITILNGCNGCGACEAINNDVFRVDLIAHINKEKVKYNKKDCISASKICPTGAIWIENLSNS